MLSLQPFNLQLLSFNCSQQALDLSRGIVFVPQT